MPQRNITITDAVLATRKAPAASKAGRHLLAPAASSNYSAADVSAEIVTGSQDGATAVQSALQHANLQVDDGGCLHVSNMLGDIHSCIGSLAEGWCESVLDLGQSAMLAPAIVRTLADKPTSVGMLYTVKHQ